MPDPDLTPDWAPTLADVGAVLRARTRDAGGHELGTFTTATRPTDDEVTAMMATALDEVLLRVPVDVELTGRRPRFAKQLVVLRTAMSIELSYNPDRTDEGSAYANFRDLYRDGLTRFAEAVDVAAEDDTPAVPSVL